MRHSKSFILAVSLLLLGSAAYAEDDMDALMAQVAPQDGPVIATFKSTRIIDMPTTEVVGKGDLNFSLSHHLGPISTGPGQAFGLDMAKIRLQFEYGLTDRLQVELGRTNDGFKPVDLSLKLRVLRQSTSGSMPVSLTVQAAGFYGTSFTGSDTLLDLTPVRRISSTYHLLIARKWNDKLSTELMGALVLRNLYPSVTDHFATPIAGIGGRYKLSQRIAVTADFAMIVPPTYNGQNYSPVAGIGLDMDTGGHIFQVFICNSPWLNDDRLLTETSGSLGDFGTDMRIGFQINRTFALGK